MSKNKNDKLAVEMLNICKNYGGVNALKEVNFNVRACEIHALVGQNGAGKSTLIKILGGVTVCDKGNISILGKKIPKGKLTPSLTHSLGVSFMYQEPMIIPGLNIAENIFLGREEVQWFFGWLKTSYQHIESKKLLEPFELEWDTRTKVGELGLGKRRILEVVRAIGQNAKIFVMDEPTAALTTDEKEWLFNVLKKLKKQGNSIIFVSHYLDEVLEIADRITVLRDGKLVETIEVNNELKLNHLCSLVVGYEFEKSKMELKKPVAMDKKIFEVRNISKKNKFYNISFSINPGEILGIGGLIGSGFKEVALALFGVSKIDSGEILMNGEKKNFRNAVDAIKARIGFVPEDRKEQGLILSMTVRQNMTLPILSKIINLMGFINQNKERNIVKFYSNRLNIIMENQDIITTSLSGGNAQKVVMAKWLMAKPAILIANEPTRGVDIASREEIHKILFEITSEGVSIIMVTSEIDELCDLCHNVLVMKDGNITHRFKKGDVTKDQLLSYIME